MEFVHEGNAAYVDEEYEKAVDCYTKVRPVNGKEDVGESVGDRGRGESHRVCIQSSGKDTAGRVYRGSQRCREGDRN